MTEREAALATIALQASQDAMTAYGDAATVTASMGTSVGRALQVAITAIDDDLSLLAIVKSGMPIDPGSLARAEQEMLEQRERLCSSQAWAAASREHLSSIVNRIESEKEI